MKTYEIECRGETHQIGVAEEHDSVSLAHDIDEIPLYGPILVLFNHDVEAENIALELGDEAPECMYVLRKARDSLQGLLRWAVRRNQPGIALLAINYGALAYYANSRALHYASQFNSWRVIPVLIEHGADVHTSEDAPLRYALDGDYMESVVELVKHGANIHIWEDYPLRRAADAGDLELVKFFVKHGAAPNAIVDAVRSAGARGHQDVVDYLQGLDHRARMTGSPSNGK